MNTSRLSHHFDFVVGIDTGNAAFFDGEIDRAGRDELARMLRHLADQIEDQAELTYLCDYNGITAGQVFFDGAAVASEDLGGMFRDPDTRRAKADDRT